MIPILLVILQASLPVATLPWFQIAIGVALIVMGISVMIYMLAPILNSSAIKQWAVVQIYEALLSIILILFFLGVVVGLLFLSPQPIFSSAKLVPTGCTGATTIFTLSSCDLGQFVNASYSVGSILYWTNIVTLLLPTLTLKINPIPLVSNVSFSVTDLKLGFQSSSNSLFGYAADTIMALVLLSQLQLIVLSSAPLFLSLFFAIGLVTRVFGISRGFGGAMIAFAIGVGIIFPLITCITYGFVDVRANTNCLQSFKCSFGQKVSTAGTIAGAIATSNYGSSFGGALMTYILSPFSALAGATSSAATALTASSGGTTSTITQTLGASLATVISGTGYILTGLILLPIFNLIVVDVFIIDLSKAAGERLSFASMFRSLV